MEIDSAKPEILLVDDNEGNLLVLEAILEGPDRRLVRAASGNEALQYLLYHDVALILLDVQMPGIDGLETADLIRGRKQSRHVPILFLTAYESADDANLARGYALGAVDYLIKPFNPVALKSKVAVFVELFKKNEQVRQQGELLREQNIQLENANFQRLGKLVDTGQRLAAERDPHRLVQMFCDAASDTIGARYAAVTLMDGGGQRPRSIVNSECSQDNGLRPEGELLHLIAPGRHLLRLSQTELAELRPRLTARASAVARQTASSSTIRSLLRVPVSLPDQPLGWLDLADKLDGDEFTEADERLALTMTAQLAVAYQNASLYAAAQLHADELQREVAERKLAEKERERLLISEQKARAEAERAYKVSEHLLVREQEARGDAEAASRFKDEFLATVSHELRTPLNAMLGWARLLRDKRLDPNGADRAIEVIERNAKAQARIVEDILEVSRIITGKLSMITGPVEFIPIIETVANSLRPASDSKRLILEMKLEAAADRLVGDPDRLQQIVWNLLSNAIKFTPTGGRVQVALQRVGSNVELTVTDSGQGIGPEFLPYVFERFRQADSSISRAHGGLGLGLAIVRHLVELHGGTVSAHSDGVDEGATFVVILPLTEAPEGHVNEERLSAPSSRTTGPLARKEVDLTGLSILVVDDEADARDLVAAILRQSGADVRAAATASIALAMLSESQPDVLLSDMSMPEEDGYDLIRQVRALPGDQGGNTPAAAITAYAGAEDRRRALSSGYQAHIAKPTDQTELLAVVANLAGRAPR